MMQAVVLRREEGLVLESLPIPVPDPDQVLIRVSDAGFCGSDHSIVENRFVTDGYILGHEVSGTVAQVGARVEGVSPGERVTVRPTCCGECLECRAGRPALCRVRRRAIGTGDMPGGFAEYLLAYPDMLIPIPEGVDSRNAALAEVFATSLHAILAAGVTGGGALVMGGGPVGLALVQLLRNRGFSPVVLSEPVASKRTLSLQMGASHTVDPTREDLVGFSGELTGGRGFEVAFECAGVGANIQQAVHCASPRGVVSVVSVMGGQATLAPLSLNLYREITITGSWSSSQEENRACLEGMARGLLDGRPMISDLLSLADLPVVYRDRIHPGKAVKVMVRIGPEF